MPAPLTGRYYYGVFEDGDRMQIAATFAAMCADLAAHEMNVVAFTNNTGDLNESDGVVRVIAAEFAQLYNNFYDTGVAATIANARAVVYPIADAMSPHASLLGYNIRDDASQSMNTKMGLVRQAFTERDAVHPSAPMLVFEHQARIVYDYVEPDAFLGYRYPFRIPIAACDLFNSTDNRYWWHTIRMSQQLRPQSDPLWLVLQAHDTMTGVGDTNPAHLRQPTQAEMSLQFWVALAEEATGWFWFIYSTQQSWTGLGDAARASDFNHAAALGATLWTLDATLESVQRIPDRFSVTGANYISTYRSLTDATAYYVIAVNDSASTANLSITSAWFTGTLRDLLTAQTFALGAAISFPAGTGRMFAVESLVALTPPSAGTNLVTPSFGEVTFSTPGTNTQQRNITLEPDTEYYVNFDEAGVNLNASDVGVQVLQLTPTISPNLLAQLNWIKTGTYDSRKVVGWFKTPANHATARIQLVGVLASGQSVTFNNVEVVRADEYSAREYLVERLAVPAGGGPPDAPTITSHPGNTTVDEGDSAMLTVVATGAATLTYQWYTGTSGDTGAPIGGATSASRNTGALSVTTSYWVRVTNGSGSADSNTATVTVTPQNGQGYVLLLA